VLKDQRLLDLAALLLKAAEPVSWREIQEQFPEDYAGTGEAAIRKFERDKADLLELGIPVRYAAGDEDLPAGYLIDKDEFYLPDLKLPPEDLALLYLAGSAALAQGTFPYARDLAHALNKLSFAARAPGASEAAALGARLSAEDEVEDRAGAASRVEELSRAIAHKKRVHLVYRGAERRGTTERDVDPYGLYQQGGAWLLVGHCHLRKALRTFHLSRIESLLVNPAAPRTADFVTPAGFSIAAHAHQDPWEYKKHAPLRCRVLLDLAVGAEVLASFGPRARLREDARGTVLELEVTNGEGLLRHVLALGDQAEVLAPRELRERARATLSAIARRTS
jgi:proteasome accessory factor B